MKITGLNLKHIKPNSSVPCLQVHVHQGSFYYRYIIFVPGHFIYRFQVLHFQYLQNSPE